MKLLPRCQNRLVSLRKDMNSIQDKVARLSKRASKLDKKKRERDQISAVKKQKEIEKERQLRARVVSKDSAS